MTKRSKKWLVKSAVLTGYLKSKRAALYGAALLVILRYTYQKTVVLTYHLSEQMA
jgi:hypothetical protein